MILVVIQFFHLYVNVFHWQTAHKYQISQDLMPLQKNSVFDRYKEHNVISHEVFN